MELSRRELLNRWIYGTFKGRRLGILVLVAGVGMGIVGSGVTVVLHQFQLGEWIPYWLIGVLLLQLLFPLLYASTLANVTLYYPDSFQDAVDLIGFREIFARFPNVVGLLVGLGIVVGVWGALFSVGVWIEGKSYSLHWIEGLPAEMVALSPAGLYCWLITLLFLLFTYPFFGKFAGGLGEEQVGHSLYLPISTFWDFRYLLGTLHRNYWVAFTTLLQWGLPLGIIGGLGIGATVLGVVTETRLDLFSLLIGMSWGVGIGTPAISLFLNLVAVAGGAGHLSALAEIEKDEGVVDETTD